MSVDKSILLIASRKNNLATRFSPPSFPYDIINKIAYIVS